MAIGNVHLSSFYCVKCLSSDVQLIVPHDNGAMISRLSLSPAAERKFGNERIVIFLTKCIQAFLSLDLRIEAGMSGNV